MTEGTVERPVRVVDNGRRSFIPPTFCFELRDAASDAPVATVSHVVLSHPPRGDFDAVRHLTDEGLAATGVISRYDAGPQAREPGLRFTIHATTRA